MAKSSFSWLVEKLEYLKMFEKKIYFFKGGLGSGTGFANFDDPDPVKKGADPTGSDFPTPLFNSVGKFHSVRWSYTIS
jgi:hypothetical protein